MVNEQENPLGQYFRGSSIYTRLPSCGFYSAPEDIEKTPDGEIEIFAMTTADELLFKSPDALLNGESVAKVIQSCAPGIKNVYTLPINDIETLLLAIRLATYETQIDFTAPCPECAFVQEFGVDIEWLLNNMTVLEPNIQVSLKNDLVVKLKPYTYNSSVKAALLSFNEGKFLQMLMEDDLTDQEKNNQAAASYSKAVTLTIELLAGSIISVEDKDGKVITDDPKYILEWINNISRQDTKIIEETVKIMNNVGVPREMEISCDSCQHTWNTAITIDPSHFFEAGS